MDTAAIADALLSKDSAGGLADSKVMDLSEFGRDIHAEMSAITEKEFRPAAQHSIARPFHAICAPNT
jgi:hypothetical protein